MVQSINFHGILGFSKVLLNPSLAVPLVAVPDLRFIQYQRLFKDGYSAIVFDKDNCLTHPYESTIAPIFLPAFQNCVRIFGKDNIGIYSNSAGTPDDKDEIKAKSLEAQLGGVKVIRHSIKKPGGDIDLILKQFKLQEASKLVWVGDRLLTDVVFANKHRCLSIHTYQILSESKDNLMAKLIRRIENKWLYGTSTPKYCPNVGKYTHQYFEKNSFEIE